MCERDGYRVGILSLALRRKKFNRVLSKLFMLFLRHLKRYVLFSARSLLTAVRQTAPFKYLLLMNRTIGLLLFLRSNLLSHTKHIIHKNLFHTVTKYYRKAKYFYTKMPNLSYNFTKMKKASSEWKFFG